MKSYAIIPARGGSKRIPRKNLKEFAGKPIIAHSIIAALESGLFSRVVVSTDDDEIAAVAKKFGAEIPFMRPPELADDHAVTDAVLIHALEWFRQRDELPDYFCCIYATAPFVSTENLRRGFDLLREQGAATAFSVTSFASSIYRALRISETGRIEPIWPENAEKRSQDLPDAYFDVGQFYWGNTSLYLSEGHLYSSNAVPVPIPRYLAQDIDTPEDWKTAELMYRALYEIR
ncbi:pseudaminic acid cytidylyltransferase [Geobacter sp. OR-1]|uniref:pseudaminic acid cytidylyltransferase n=1 Tax=Geobacter sp. OR-1 TaxID=1266765 RepID=UPI000542D9C6|nr:pseudaminic acid cytidylyltransferase [Geobacter sp. OR-1]GAM09653.1 pseudaminic acid cytidylyltransferase [Geobacter sp. OR-1]